MPRSADLLRDIRETNLTYLRLMHCLAKQREGLTIAGVTLQEDTWRWLESLSPAEQQKLAKSSLLLSQLNFSSTQLLSAFTQDLSTIVAPQTRRASQTA